MVELPGFARRAPCNWVTPLARSRQPTRWRASAKVRREA